MVLYEAHQLGGYLSISKIRKSYAVARVSERVFCSLGIDSYNNQLPEISLSIYPIFNFR